MSDYKDKIRKLLALAQSPEEGEAKAALLRARELMAKHKLTEADLKESGKQKVRRVMTDITCSKRRDPWLIALSVNIATHYCCVGYGSHKKWYQTQHIGFIGLEDDVEICAAIFNYAVDCINAGIKAVKKEHVGYDPLYIKQQCDSYGYGFVNGINAAFKGQDEEKRGEWGLVLAVPQEVQEATQNFQEKHFKSRSEDAIDPHAYAQGYEHGKEFDPARRLGEGVTA